MAAVRPIVLVYQDFASVTPVVTVPDLNTLMVGPCYDIVDYPADKASSLFGTVGSLTTVPSGVVSPGVAVNGVIPGIRAGAKIDATSLVVNVEEAYAELAYGTDGVIVMDQNTFTTAANLLTSGVKVGDRLVVTDLDSTAGVVTVAKTIQAINAAGTILTLTSNFATSGKDVSGAAYGPITPTLTGLKYRVERLVSGATNATGSGALDGAALVPTLQVASLKVTVEGGLKPITYAKVYPAYRAMRTDLGSDIDTVSSTSEILGKLGKIDSRNPLAVAASVAFQNCTRPIQFLGVTADTLVGHTLARDAITGRRDIYCIVPLTQDISTIAMWKNHCVALSVPEIAKFRIVIGSGTLTTSKVVYPATGTSTCTLETDTGNYFKLLDNGATFISTAVAAGDLVTLAGSDYVVDSILSENRLRLVGVKPVATTYSIHRTLTRDQQVADLAAVSASLKSSRCTMIWPDQCVVAGISGVQPGYYTAAAVGGMVSGLPPHQGFTFIGIAGISQLYNSNTWFYDSHIDTLSSAGWFVMVQDTPKSLPYSIHELTTDTTTLESGELMVVKNYDYVSGGYRDAMRGYLGVYNVTTDTMDFLRAGLDGVTAKLQSQRYPKIGAPLISASIDSVAVPTGTDDQIDAYVGMKLPRPLNRIGLHLKA